jgi:tRNA dimethylallyltransferase
MDDYRTKGLPWLQEEVRTHDPLFFQKGEVQNPQRLMRALEVCRATGQSILSFRKGKKEIRPFGIIKIGLELPREILYQRINTRVDQMMEQGLAEEVRSLIPYQHLNALQTVGYRELFDHFNGELSFEEAIALIKQNTRQYAKRQMTWFRKDKDYHWLPPDSKRVLELIDTFLK